MMRLQERLDPCDATGERAEQAEVQDQRCHRDGHRTARAYRRHCQVLLTGFILLQWAVLVCGPDSPSDYFAVQNSAFRKYGPND